MIPVAKKYGKSHEIFVIQKVENSSAVKNVRPYGEINIIPGLIILCGWAERINIGKPSWRQKFRQFALNVDIKTKGS